MVISSLSIFTKKVLYMKFNFAVITGSRFHFIFNAI